MTSRPDFSTLQDNGFVNRLAHASGLIKRKRKVTGIDLIVAVLCSVVKQVPSYNVMSHVLFAQRNKDVSRQRLHKIISSSNFASFFKDFLNHLWQCQVIPDSHSVNGKFKRVLLQDSTILKLPKRLFSQYSGVANGAVSVTNCRVQICVDLMTNLLQTLAIDSYSINDLKARHYINPQKGDLVIRDRGYFAFDQVIKFVKEGVHFIIRHKSNNLYYDQCGKPINLIKVLSKRRTTVLRVRLTKEEGPMLTLFAQKVSEEITASRSRAARLSMKGRNASKQTLEQLQWSIFITDLDSESYEFEEVWKLYSTRWRIEILFKTLKTHLHLDSIQNVSSNQLQIIIHARIALIFLITTAVYNPLQAMITQQKSNKKISLIKLVGNLLIDIDLLVQAIIYFTKNKHRQGERIIQKLLKTTVYDTRARVNYRSLLENMVLS
jgi:hypothetical protein